MENYKSPPEDVGTQKLTVSEVVPNIGLHICPVDAHNIANWRPLGTAINWLEGIHVVVFIERMQEFFEEGIVWDLFLQNGEHLAGGDILDVKMEHLSRRKLDHDRAFHPPRTRPNVVLRATANIVRVSGKKEKARAPGGPHVSGCSLWNWKAKGHSN